MHATPRRLALLAGAAAILCVSAAFAQDASPPPPPGPPPPMEDGPGGPMMMMHRHHDPEARAQHLRDVLQLRPDQDGALKAYLAATEPKAWGKDADDKDGPDMTPDADGPPPRLTTPERLDREAERLAKATEAFKARAAATRAFYAALSPSQKKAFDALGPMLGEHGPMIRRSEMRRMKGGHESAPPSGDMAPSKRKPN